MEYSGDVALRRRHEIAPIRGGWHGTLCIASLIHSIRTTLVSARGGAFARGRARVQRAWRSRECAPCRRLREAATGKQLARGADEDTSARHRARARLSEFRLWHARGVVEFVSELRAEPRHTRRAALRPDQRRRRAAVHDLGSRG